MNKVFDKNWFKEHQNILVKLARSWVGEILFQFKETGHYVDRKKIAKIGPNSVAEILEIREGEVILREQFFQRNAYAENLKTRLYPLWMSFHIWDFFADTFVPKLSFGFLTLTANPQAGGGGGNTTVDGNVLQDSVDETFATIRGDAGNGFSVTGSNSSIVRVESSGTLNQYSRMDRSIYTFDTSSLTSSATISATVFSLYIDTAPTNGLLGDASANSAVVLVAATPAAANNLQNSDYAQTGTTDFGRWGAQNTLSSGGSYNDITANASGIANVSKTGVSKFGIRYGWDFDNTTTGLTWTPNADQFIQARYADNVTNIPKLVVTYTLPATATGNFLAFM